MEPIIKFRLLASQLQAYEPQQLIQKLGFNKIISLIFNSFVLTFNKTQQHHHELSNIKNIISDIINSRDKNKSYPNQLTNTITLQIDELPFEMIGECASYLDITDYMNFSLCNRNIYCASNAPIKLHELNLFWYDNYNMINLNKFSMIKGLCIRAKIFNKLQITIGQFPYLQRLSLYNDNTTDDDYGDEDDVNRFIDSKAINFDQITHLSLSGFGEYQWYDFDSFCHLLIQFPNVTHLELFSICLTECETNNDKIMKITPKLQALYLDLMGVEQSDSICLLINKLLNMYSKQICHLYINFDIDIEIYSFPKLNVLCIHAQYHNANDNLAKILLSSTCNMKTIEMGYNYCTNSKVIQDSLVKSFKNTPSISVLQFVCQNKKETEYITSTIEKMLNSREINRKSLKIRITVTTGTKHNIENFEMRDIESYIKRIMNALDLLQIENIMLIFNFPKQIDKNKYGDTIIERFIKSSHLAVIIKDPITKYGYCNIILSNEHCKINGYYNWLKGFGNCEI